MMFGMMCIAPLMIALSLGYLVLVKAKKEETPFKLLGYSIGVLVIAISASLVLSQAIMMMAPGGPGCCPMSKSMMGKGMMGKRMMGKGMMGMKGMGMKGMNMEDMGMEGMGTDIAPGKMMIHEQVPVAPEPAQE